MARPWVGDVVPWTLPAFRMGGTGFWYCTWMLGRLTKCAKYGAVVGFGMGPVRGYPVDLLSQLSIKVVALLRSWL